MAPHSEADFQLSQPAGRPVLFGEELRPVLGHSLAILAEKNNGQSAASNTTSSGLDPVVLPNGV